MRNIKLKIFFAFALAPFALISCKKDKGASPEIVEASRTQLTLDSIFLYAKQTYLWNESLPSYEAFNPRSYVSSGTDLSFFEKELLYITRYKINSSTGKAYEYSADEPNSPKYSYIDDNSNSGTTSFVPSAFSSVELDGKGTDFGMGLSAVTATDIRIRYVNPSSPAANAGLKRGDRIVTINNHTARADSETEVNYINTAFNSSTMSLVVQTTNGTSRTVSLTQASYTTSPVIKTTVITRGSKKIGYLVFSRFSTLSNAESALNNAFAGFASAGVTDLVVDLRYNGGGYVATAEHLINLIAPSSLNGKVMYTEYYNDMMQKGNASILKYQPLYDSNDKIQPYTSGVNGKYVTYADVDYSISGNTYKFSKNGSLDNIKTVCFIVSGNTASASELTINSLKPYLTVKLIGSTTYGKPVGFFGITIDKYTVYMSNFQSRNANGEGDYFSGMTADITATDDVTRDFGDESEVCLSKALAYLTTGTTISANTTMSLKNGTTVSSTEVVPVVIPTGNSFTGMVENRHKLK
ncbi:S41 family peptidase [Desertivirga arenae]|uniref:S41 family peptidase n=1 Tax=Desertivirga arenae TaxID=2810309 RepID=UPI001A97B85D|nr:S41 family peptidase [Pedobacter sp. SYSU D00823]